MGIEVSKDSEETSEEESVFDKAARGIEINSKIKKLEKELGSIKNDLRVYATKKSGESGEQVEIETEKGTVKISFKDDRFYVSNKDSDRVLEIREEEVIDEDAFNSIFQEVVNFALKDGYEKPLAVLNEEQKEKVKRLISKTVYKPSVSFPSV